MMAMWASHSWVPSQAHPSQPRAVTVARVSGKLAVRSALTDVRATTGNAPELGAFAAAGATLPRLERSRTRRKAPRY